MIKKLQIKEKYIIDKKGNIYQKLILDNGNEITRLCPYKEVPYVEVDRKVVEDYLKNNP